MKTELKKIPNHIGIIIDGNGRWAKERGMIRTMGHRAGLKNLDMIIKECFYTYGIKSVSIYAFSTANWNRPKAEVDYLMKAFRRYVKRDFNKYFPDCKLNIMGDITRFDKDLADGCREVMQKTKDNTKFTLNLGLNYDGQSEIVYAVNKALQSGKTQLTIEDIEDNLYTHGQPKLDLIIRTSGEYRLSGFMLWQAAYSEFYFTPTYWPAFKKKDLYEALKNYQNRDRRFGAIKE